MEMLARHHFFMRRHQGISFKRANQNRNQPEQNVDRKGGPKNGNEKTAKPAEKKNEQVDEVQCLAIGILQSLHVAVHPTGVINPDEKEQNEEGQLDGTEISSRPPPAGYENVPSS